MYVQPIGERRSTKAESRVLHFDLNVGAIQLVEKETLRQTIRLDVVNQLIYDQSGGFVLYEQKSSCFLKLYPTPAAQ